ncbi:hypothetical protein Tco_0318089 [Tanacetum coccineum]
MTTAEYMEYEAEMKRRRNARSYFPTKYEDKGMNSFHHDTSRVLDYLHHSDDSKFNAYTSINLGFVTHGQNGTAIHSHIYVAKELLPPKKRIHSPSSSSTTLSNPSRNQTRNLVSPSSSVYTPTPPQIFEIGKSSVKIHLKHHEEQIEDILNYLDELSFHRIEKMEEGRIDRMIIRRNSDELKTELKKIRTQIIKLQKKQLGQKDKIAFAYYRISDLEQIIEKIQARHQTDQEDL